jgi:hypothetical protein
LTVLLTLRRGFGTWVCIVYVTENRTSVRLTLFLKLKLE